VTDDGLEGPYEALRAAAIQVLDAAPGADGLLGTALERLRDALRGDPPPVDVPPGQPVLDPFAHYLSELRYERGQPPRAITLERMALDLRRQLDNDRELTARTLKALNARLPWEPDQDVIVTELRGMVIGALLRELAVRLSPGAAFGPGKNGEALAGVALALAKQLFDQTFVGGAPE
jgi:hypothetical protein